MPADRERLLELAARCEAAEGADRLLDADIRRAMPVEIQETRTEHNPPYTASLDAALTLVPEGWAWQAGVGIETEIGAVDRAYAWAAPVNEGELAFATTPALALCAAALNARALAHGDDQ